MYEQVKQIKKKNQRIPPARAGRDVLGEAERQKLLREYEVAKYEGDVESKILKD